MKLFDYSLAPNCRRVRMFLAEKGVSIPMENVDLRSRDQLNEAYRAVNPRCDVPFLILDDGTGIGEVDAVCRYMEALYPDPPLYGASREDQAVVTMWNHRMFMEGLVPGMEALRNSHKFFEDRALVGPKNYVQIPELAARGRQRLTDFFDFLDSQLADRPFIAGEIFSIADITAIVAVDFAGRVEMGPGEGHTALKRWHGAVSARPSAQA
ncbi:MAG: glutathione S-transferase family protein [Magnetospiraceae bacterium]